MNLIQKICKWLLRNVPRRERERERVAEKEIAELRRKVERESSPLAPKPGVNRSAIRMHRAGGRVDPELFKDAKLAKPELPHSDPASPFYPYWLQSQGGGIPGFMAGAIIEGELDQRQPEPNHKPDFFSQNEPVKHHCEPERHHEPYQHQPDPISSSHHATHSGADTWGNGHDTSGQCDYSGGYHHHE